MRVHCPRVAQLGGSLDKLQVGLGHPSMTWRAAGVTEEAQHELGVADVLQSQRRKQKQRHGAKPNQMGATPDHCTPGRTELPLPVPQGHLSPVGSGTRTGGL